MPATASSPSNCLMIANYNNNGTTPDFPLEVAHEFFKEVCLGTSPNQHECWHLQLPALRQSLTVMWSKKMRSPGPSNTLSHSPFDQVSYLIFKRCPALQTALLDLFNTCWSQSVISTQWKMAAIKLIEKPSAMDEPTSPSNFHPIAVTSCIGKLFTAILRNRWLTSEGLHECHTKLCWASLQAGHNPSWGKEKAQVPRSVLAGSRKCIW